MNYASDSIDYLQENDVFVFSTNMALNYRGSLNYYKAVNIFDYPTQLPIGAYGKCYAIPTKDAYGRVLPLDTIKRHINKLKKYILLNTQFNFLFTQVGCEDDEYVVEDLILIYEELSKFENVYLPNKIVDSIKCLKMTI